MPLKHPKPRPPSRLRLRNIPRYLTGPYAGKGMPVVDAPEPEKSKTPVTATRLFAPHRGAAPTITRIPLPESVVPAQIADWQALSPLSHVAWHCPSKDCNPGVFRMGLTAAVQPAAEAIFALSRRNSGTPGATCPYCGTDAPDETFLQPGQPGPAGDVGLHELACDVCSRPYGV